MPGHDVANYFPSAVKAEEELTRPFSEEGYGLALSGGGYKAAAFHIGGLIRLNELRMLRQVRRLASVSGGSITAGHLAAVWDKLNWDKKTPDGFAEDFLDTFAKPLKTFLTECNIDAPQALLGLVLPFKSAADGVVSAYDKELYKKKRLADLPDAVDDVAPEFCFLATSYQLNSLWVFSKAKASNYRIGRIDTPDFSLAQVVTASSAFPPFFCPLKLDFKGQTVVKTPLADKHVAPYTSRAELCDGGIYDNMGLEPIVKNFKNILVSNAGNPFDEKDDPPDNWASLMRRIISMVHRQAENNRIRWLMDLVNRDERELALWPLRTDVSKYPKPSQLKLAAGEVEKAQGEDVRLWSLSEGGFKRLANYGYILADSALQSYMNKPAATQLPF